MTESVEKAETSTSHGSPATTPASVTAVPPRIICHPTETSGSSGSATRLERYEPVAHAGGERRPAGLAARLEQDADAGEADHHGEHEQRRDALAAEPAQQQHPERDAGDQQGGEVG